MLDGSSSELTPHVGHEVEITGMIEPSSSGSAGTSATTTGAGATTTSGAAGASQHLKVSSVKMISSTCTK